MYADGFTAYRDGFSSGLMPDPALWVDEWADQFQRIPVESGAAEAGKYRTARTPYAREVMRVLSPGHPCRRVVVMGASQMLKTQVFLNWMGAVIHMAPGNMLALEPSLNLAKRLSSRIEKTISAVEPLQQKVAPARSRDSKNTVDTKEFSGGTIYITTAGSAANLAEVPARYLYGDEIDRWERNLNAEGDPVDLAENRTTTFGRNAKIYYSSSPTLEGGSRIKDLHDQGDQRQYHVPCPHCGTMQVLRFEQLAWNAGQTEAHYVCPENGCCIEEHHKTAMLAAGEWRASAQGDGETVSFHIDAMYMPLGWVSWTSLKKQHDKASQALKDGDPDPMQVFYNTRLARVWDNAVDRTRGAELMARAEDYALRTIPPGVLKLTAAVDVQANRLELLVKGWGEGMENWVIDHSIIMGDPALDDTWERLDAELLAEFVHPCGKVMRIDATGIDTGGRHTHEVYQFCRLRKWRNVLALKGASQPNKPVISQRASSMDVNWRGTVQKGGVELWHIGTDTAKDWIYNRFKLLSGPGATHFSRDLPEEFYDQLTAERKLVRFVKGHAVTSWTKAKTERNEVLDLSVYNLAMAHHLGLHRLQQREWAALRAQYSQTSLFEAAAIRPPVEPAREPIAPAAQPALPAARQRAKTRSSYLRR
ncbi:phage terminase large subunit family protein [Laribacter hongkongensis]|uniref:phage terminase large subunit family protein n=1 Tax=Laribacter hongkongensis TaxID=168471 RepID=UPI001EFE7E6E|nr:phage terminase large subunit family protein [Laribacter hongkongensis]MCG8991807.1 phage terminase large subunit family protein [Laribacter hongkongensis]MCG8998731.1 phage terminase large subunit family protein [Laribacter hongkongensis]MCG9000194.1 phage terminase large subunit family protein [Laribacter hongkongensis]MCG9004449.1 phage terminase large subunit family protein [Laribacter hongkongensis]MCG9006585.1 phage terminase large subunit family protein [Laribacter hongkongensis]